MISCSEWQTLWSKANTIAASAQTKYLASNINYAETARYSDPNQSGRAQPVGLPSIAPASRNGPLILSGKDLYGAVQAVKPPAKPSLRNTAVGVEKSKIQTSIGLLLHTAVPTRVYERGRAGVLVCYPVIQVRCPRPARWSYGLGWLFIRSVSALSSSSSTSGKLFLWEGIADGQVRGLWPWLTWLVVWTAVLVTLGLQCGWSHSFEW